MVQKKTLLNRVLDREKIKKIINEEFKQNITRYDDNLITLQFNQYSSILNIFFKTHTNNKTSFQAQGKEKETAEKYAIYLIEKSNL